MPISVFRNDITKMHCDAIVNPANSLGMMGGGVAGVLKKVGGAEIEKEAMEAAPIPVGKAVATTAGKLHARWVIHAPTMEGPAEKIGAENVQLATRAALELAQRLGVKTIAFPGMGTGVGGMHPHLAARAMADEVKKYPRLDVALVARDEDLERAFFCELGCEEYHSAVAVLKHGERLLIMQRSQEVSGFQGLYYFAAGHMVGNEPLETAYEEVEEETGIPRSKLRLLRSGLLSSKKEGITFVRHVHLFETETDRVQLNWENTDARWVRLDEVDRFECVPFLKDDLRAVGLL